jgi:hypothetical protein
VYTAANPRSAYQNFKIQNFNNFLNFRQPKGCFLPDRQKSPEFYAIKNVKKTKPIQAVFKNKKQRATAPASTADHAADPKKVKKIDFDFCPFFSLRFLGQAPRCGSKVRRLVVQK